MAAKKYSDAIRIRETKSAYNIQTEESNEWKNFIPNEQFNAVLMKVIGSVSNKVIDEHRSFWFEGTYGTGKSHAAAVIKHLLCDPVEDIKDYVDSEFSDTRLDLLRESLYALRKEMRLFPVTMYGSCSISHKDDLSLQIQSHIHQALEKAGIEISVTTDFDNYIDNIEKNAAIWDSIIDQNAELASYTPNRTKLIKALKEADPEVFSLMKNALRESGLNVRLKQENLIKWFLEVQDKLAETTEYKGIFLIWDEFTDVMLSEVGSSLMVDLQELAEATQQTQNNSYVFHIAHPSALDSLKAEERTRTIGRYCYMHYNMESVSAFKIMSRKFIHDSNPDNQAYYAYESLVQKRFPMMEPLFEKYAEGSNDQIETIKDLKQLFPVHPGTANLATYYAREAGSSSRSVFEFLGSNPAIREFLDSEEHFSNGDMITADYLWDFVLDEFNSKVIKYGVVTERYNSYQKHVENQGANYLAVFKVILLLNALNNLANNETVTPSEENIRNMFACTPIDQQIDEILDWINIQGVVQRSPQGLYEIRFSALDTKEIAQYKTLMLNEKFKYTSHIINFGNVATEEFDKLFKGVNRPCKYGLFSEDINKTTLLNNVYNASRSASPYELFFALMFARTNTEYANLKQIIEEESEQERFANVTFFLFDTTLDNQDFDRFIEYQANAMCANQHGFAEQNKSHIENAEAIISTWIRNIKSGNCLLCLRSERTSVWANKLAATINSSISPTIFNKGVESVEIVRLKAPQTCWAKQHTKGIADTILSFNTKDEITSRCPANAKHVPLLLQDSVDDNLNIKADCDVNHPVNVVCSFVKSKIDHADKQNVFNLAEKFEGLTEPPYGLFYSFSGYGLLAFALRPYVDKVFDTNGKPINAQRMVELINETFKIWESGSSRSSKVDVKFETKEEGSIAKGLIVMFGLNKLKDYKDVTSLTDARWALRNGYCKEIGYPLWAIKYSPAMQEKENKEDLCKMIDNIIKIYTEVGAKDPHLMAETDNQITTLKYDLIPMLNLDDKIFNKGFHAFLMADTEVNLREEDYSDAVQFIKQNMEMGVGLWTEEAVKYKLMSWAVYKANQKQQPAPQPVSTVPPEKPKDPNKKSLAKAKVYTIPSLDRAKDLLNTLCDLDYDIILDTILK